MSDCQNLVHVKVVNAIIKHMIKVIKELNDLMGGAVGADRGEAHDVAEEDGGSLKHLWLGHLT